MSRSQNSQDSKRRSARGATGQPTGQLVTVRLPDGRLVQGERLTEGPVGGNQRGASGPASGHQQTLVLMSPPGGPRSPRRRRWFHIVPRWVRWTVVLVVLGVFFRRAVAWAVLAALSGALHLFGAEIHLPHVTFGWPWSSSAVTSTTDVGPLVLQKIEGVDKPALGTTTFNFLFTHSVSKPLGVLPCWYSATFYAVGRASATVNLNPGPSWWKPSTEHYVLRVLSQPTASAPGTVSVALALPLPQLPQSVHDVSIDNTLSKPVSSDHSWTYPGLACGVLLKPQFSQSVLYAQAQSVAFQQATTLKSVTTPLIAAAERQASTIINGNFITPTLAALNYKVSQFSIHWVSPPASG